jgi:ATP:ADP antiporter, AAA family
VVSGTCGVVGWLSRNDGEGRLNAGHSIYMANDRAQAFYTALFCAAAVTAQYVAGKATRDALFLTSLSYTELPAMLMGSAVCSIALVAGYGRWAARFGSARLVPASFVCSALLFAVEYATRSAAPSVTAIAVYLHVSAIAPLLASGFWLLASEGFDPRTAKRRFGQIAGAGTLGGLLGALISERAAGMVGVPAMLLILAAFQVVAASLAARLAGIIVRREAAQDAAPEAPAGDRESTPAYRSGLRAIAEAPHLRRIVALVVLGTTGAALVEYLFKAKAVETFGPGDHLLRFFALYYAGTSLLTFLIQILSSRSVLQRFGVALTTSAPSIALLAGGVTSLAVPGLGGVLVARAGESIFRGSWFRAGYELLFTPLPPSEKRAAKSAIDVAFDRLGDAFGGALVRLAVLLVPAAQSSTILAMAALTSIGAIVVASRLNRWYVRRLETSLVARGSGLQIADSYETRRTVLLEMKERQALGMPSAADSDPLASVSLDPEVQDILWLRSSDRERIVDVLSRPEGLPPGVVPYAIPLLGWDAVSEHAVFALRKVAEEHIGQLTDALMDPNQSYAVRRRLARVFSVCVSQRAADGLLVALDDERFDVRFQAARSLTAIVEKNPLIRIEPQRIYDVVLREVAVGRPVWESRRLLGGALGDSPLDESVRDRAGQSLGHVFTLLSLVLPREPLRIAFRSLHSDDRQLRGTALEYLDGVLPPSIRQRLWPFLVSRRPVQPAPDPSRVLADLLRSSRSVTLHRLSRSNSSSPRS